MLSFHPFYVYLGGEDTRIIVVMTAFNKKSLTLQ